MTPTEAELLYTALIECITSTRDLQRALIDALRTLTPSNRPPRPASSPWPKVKNYLTLRSNVPATMREIVAATLCDKKAVQNLLYGYGRGRFVKRTFTDARPNLFSLAKWPEAT